MVCLSADSHTDLSKVVVLSLRSTVSVASKNSEFGITPVTQLRRQVGVLKILIHVLLNMDSKLPIY